MLLSESYKKRLLELAGINQDVINVIKNELFQKTNPKLINKYLEKYSSWFTENGKNLLCKYSQDKLKNMMGI